MTTLNNLVLVLVAFLVAFVGVSFVPSVVEAQDRGDDAARMCISIERTGDLAGIPADSEEARRFQADYDVRPINTVNLHQFHVTNRCSFDVTLHYTFPRPAYRYAWNGDPSDPYMGVVRGVWDAWDESYMYRYVYSGGQSSRALGRVHFFHVPRGTFPELIWCSERTPTGFTTACRHPREDLQP